MAVICMTRALGLYVWLPECLQYVSYFTLGRRHTLSKRKIVPLPLWKANPETDPEALFGKGTVSIRPEL